MLKNKKAIYLLIPLNLFIWGFFIYRFYSAFSETDQPITKSETRITKAFELKDTLTYKLLLDYKDPFLKEQLHTESNFAASQAEPKTKKQSPAKEPVIIIPKQLPDIKYLGLIKNNTSGQSTALVSVNGQSKLIKQNESIDGIVFKSFSKDSLVAKWGKERIVARK